MSQITIYTTPTEFCTRITRLLDARALPYSVITLATDAELHELSQRTGRKSCPMVYVGDELIGGQRETIDAVESGRVSQLLARPETA